MRRFLFDAGSLRLYMAGDPRLRVRVDEVQAGRAEGLLPDLCLAELQYKTCQLEGKKAAEEATRRIRHSRLRVLRGSPYLELSWPLKCKYRQRFSLVDCVAIAMAQVNACRILTTDSAFEDLREPRVAVEVFRPEETTSRNG